MEVPDEIYIQPNAHDGWFEGNKPNDNFVEYIRKDIVDETIKTAEDHAYFAGREKLREALLKWAKAVKADPMIPMNIDKVINKIESL